MARFLAQAIESAQSQTLAEVEVIVVDDGSTDGSHRIAESRGARVIRQENRGVAAARNAGLASASGEYACFMDADDWVEPAYLERTSQILDREPAAGAVYSLVQLCDEEGRRTAIRGVVVAPREVPARLRRGNFLPAKSVFRVSALHAVGGYDEAFRAVEDWDLWLRLADRFEIHGISEPLAGYRINTRGLSSDPQRMLQHRLAVVRKHFGEESSTASEEAREVYAYAYFRSATDCLRQGDEKRGEELFDRAVASWPRLLGELDVYFELVLAEQPAEQYGSGTGIDLEDRAAAVPAFLRAHFARRPPSELVLPRRAEGRTLLALAMLADRAGEWARARRLLTRAFRADPRLLRSPGHLRRWLKLRAGKKVVRWVAERVGREVRSSI